MTTSAALANANANGQTVTLTPTATADGAVDWACGGGMPSKYLPAECR
ncbi:MAG: pilin [Panacagrimonas sp.]